MPHAGLWSSRHAPQVRSRNVDVASGTTEPPSSTFAHEFTRFQHAVRRLKWKLPYLADSHRKATGMLEEHLVADDEKKEIETMFKLDFYEYYTVLEKALVHLLGVWDIELTISRNTLTHTYHAAILTALQAPSNPLHEVLGTQPVFGHLLAAKQLRNRWKNADVASEDDSPPPLKAFEIEQMLMAIFMAFEHAEVLAKAHLNKQWSSECSGPLDDNEIEAEAMNYVEDMDWDMDLL